MSEEVKTENSEEVKAEETKVDETPKYTDKQLNDMIAAKSAKAQEKAQKELLEKAGVKSAEELAQLKALRDSQMSDNEKKDKALEEEKTARKADQERADKAEAKAEAIIKGVAPEKFDKLYKLAQSYEGDNMSEKVNAVLADFPEFISDKGGQSFGKETKNDKPNAEQSLRDLAFAQAGLKPKK